MARSRPARGGVQRSALGGCQQRRRRVGASPHDAIPKAAVFSRWFPRRTCSSRANKLCRYRADADARPPAARPPAAVLHRMTLHYALRWRAPARAGLISLALAMILGFRLLLPTVTTCPQHRCRRKDARRRAPRRVVRCSSAEQQLPVLSRWLSACRSCPGEPDGQIGDREDGRRCRLASGLRRRRAVSTALSGQRRVCAGPLGD